MEGEGVSADTNDNLNDDRVCKRFLAQLALRLEINTTAAWKSPPR